MEKIRIGVLCPSEIAFRRFMPALKKLEKFSYIGLAAATEREFSGADNDEVKPSELEKAEKFAAAYGGKIFKGYESLITSDEIDAVYLPLPPALHYKWGKKVLQAGKHLLMEKPFTTSQAETEELLALAAEKSLAVHENYMFLYHSQLQKVKELIADGTLGELRLLRMAFGFPKRGADDFRYKKALGGGALLDCGGYPVRLALELLGESTKVVQAQLSQPKGYEVDLFGSAVLKNEEGLCAQISFGMDNAYQCQLEVWGSKATVIAPRIFTAGADVIPKLILKASNDEDTLLSPIDNQFLHSINHFFNMITVLPERKYNNEKIAKQSFLIDQVKKEGIIGEKGRYNWSE